MSNGGKYSSFPRVEFLGDGRKFMLLEEFHYTDPAGLKWTAPKGAHADGASIPRPLWSILGGPLEGRYRDSSIIHDFYCSKRHRPWRSVHRVFFDGMITSGVPKRMANVLYAGVYVGGPRWTDMDIHNARIAAGSRGYSVAEAVGRSSGRYSDHSSYDDLYVERGRNDTSSVSEAEPEPERPPAFRYVITEAEVNLINASLDDENLDIRTIERDMDEMIEEYRPPVVEHL